MHYALDQFFLYVVVVFHFRYFFCVSIARLSHEISVFSIVLLLREFSLYFLLLDLKNYKLSKCELLETLLLLTRCIYLSCIEPFKCIQHHHHCKVYWICYGISHPPARVKYQHKYIFLSISCSLFVLELLLLFAHHI